MLTQGLEHINYGVMAAFGQVPSVMQRHAGLRPGGPAPSAHGGRGGGQAPGRLVSEAGAGW